MIDILQKITTLIVCKAGRSTVGTATGFFFRFTDKIYLITNRHVFIREENNYYPDSICIRLNKQGNDLTKSDEVKFNLYKEGTQEPLWVELQKEIDLVALEIDIDDKAYILAALTPENLSSADLSLGLGEQVLVIGYPKGFYDNIHNLPIVRSACVASPYGVPFQGNRYFLIDSNLHPGTSGSPVITVPKTIYSNPDGGLTIGGRPIFYFLGVNSGAFDSLQLNVIWYGSLIIDLLNKAQLKLLEIKEPIVTKENAE